MTRYEPRPVRFLGLWSVDGWQLKVYGIAHGRPEPRAELVAAAHQVVKDRLGLLPSGLRHYHVGFVGIHDGRTSNFVFLDFWAEENELHHHVYTSPHEAPDALTYTTPTGLSACVWDLKLQAFERDAWIEHVLRVGGTTGFSDYLAATLDAEI